MDSVFANNDLMDTEYSDDCDVSLEGIGENNGAGIYILACKAKTSEVAYQKLRMQVDAETFIPVAIEYFTRSGLLLKSCTFGERKQLAGRLRASRKEMRDASVANTRSVMTIEKMAQTNLRPNLFSVERFRK